MKACIPTSISLIGGLASHFCLFATPSMTPTDSSEPLSTGEPLPYLPTAVLDKGYIPKNIPDTWD